MVKDSSSLRSIRSIYCRSIGIACSWTRSLDFGLANSPCRKNHYIANSFSLSTMAELVFPIGCKSVRHPVFNTILFTCQLAQIQNKIHLNLVHKIFRMAYQNHRSVKFINCFCNYWNMAKINVVCRFVKNKKTGFF
jgi:hypothetical protein